MSVFDVDLSHAWMTALGWSLVHSLWQGALVALSLMAALHLLRERSANARYTAALVALGLQLVVPLVTFWVLWRSTSTPWPSPTLKPMLEAPDVALLPPLALADLPAVAPEAPTVRERLEAWMPWLSIVWLAGISLLSVRLVVGWLRLRHLRTRYAWPLEDGWPERMAALCERLEISRPVRLLSSSLVQVPTAIGWLRPVILLPAGALLGLTPAQLEAIIAHELGHIRRQDYLINLLQCVVETLLFYHPATWWISDRVRAEREHCCDDIAVNACGNALVYARALTELEQLRVAPHQLALGANGGSMLFRIRRLLNLPQPQMDRGPRLLAGALVLATAVTVGARAGASWSPADERDSSSLNPSDLEDGLLPGDAAREKSTRDPFSALFDPPWRLNRSSMRLAGMRLAGMFGEEPRLPGSGELEGMSDESALPTHQDAEEIRAMREKVLERLNFEALNDLRDGLGDQVREQVARELELLPPDRWEEALRDVEEASRQAAREDHDRDADADRSDEDGSDVDENGDEVAQAHDDDGDEDAQAHDDGDDDDDDEDDDARDDNDDHFKPLVRDRDHEASDRNDDDDDDRDDDRNDGKDFDFNFDFDFDFDGAALGSQIEQLVTQQLSQALSSMEQGRRDLRQAMKDHPELEDELQQQLEELDQQREQVKEELKRVQEEREEIASRSHRDDDGDDDDDDDDDDRDEDRRERSEQQREIQREIREAMREAREASREAMREAREAREEALREAQEAREEALREADEAREEALREAEEARAEALREAEEARRDAMKEAMEACRESMKESRRHGGDADEDACRQASDASRLYQQEMARARLEMKKAMKEARAEMKRAGVYAKTWNYTQELTVPGWSWTTRPPEPPEAPEPPEPPEPPAPVAVPHVPPVPAAPAAPPAPESPAAPPAPPAPPAAYAPPTHAPQAYAYSMDGARNQVSWSRIERELNPIYAREVAGILLDEAERAGLNIRAREGRESRAMQRLAREVVEDLRITFRDDQVVVTSSEQAIAEQLGRLIGEMQVFEVDDEEMKKVEKFIRRSADRIASVHPPLSSETKALIREFLGPQ